MLTMHMHQELWGVCICFCQWLCHEQQEVLQGHNKDKLEKIEMKPLKTERNILDYMYHEPNNAIFPKI